MLKRIVQACFLIIGVTLGIFLIPDLLKLISLDGIPLLNNPYVSAILGAIIFYLLTFFVLQNYYFPVLFEFVHLSFFKLSKLVIIFK